MRSTVGLLEQKVRSLLPVFHASIKYMLPVQLYLTPKEPSIWETNLNGVQKLFKMSNILLLAI